MGRRTTWFSLLSADGDGVTFSIAAWFNGENSLMIQKEPAGSAASRAISSTGRGGLRGLDKSLTLLQVDEICCP
jgi:hypothetical protein